MGSYDAYQRAALERVATHVDGDLKPFVRTRDNGRREVVVARVNDAVVLRCDCSSGGDASCRVAQCEVRCHIPFRALAPDSIEPTAPVSAPLERAASQSSMPQLDSLTEAARQAFAAGDFLAAGRAWARVLRGAPENRVHRERRQDAMILAAESYRRAFSRDGPRPIHERLEIRRDALATFQRYERELIGVYGSEALIEPSVRRYTQWLELDHWAELNWDVQCPAS